VDSGEGVLESYFKGVGGTRMTAGASIVLLSRYVVDMMEREEERKETGGANAANLLICLIQ
jgi:hypothetical protein